METEYPLININQIDLESLSSYLIAKNKLVYRTDCSDDNAADTDKVAGVNADTIAVAVSEDDRETVKNTLQLGGLNASEYMTTTTGNSIVKQQEHLKSNQLEEIADLRDELYQLKAELLKNGAIDYCGQYSGYTDPFRRKQYINIQDKIGTGTAIGTVSNNEVLIDDTDTFNAFDVYDFICIYNKDSEFFNVRQIISKDSTRRSFLLNSDLDGGTVIGENLELYKSQGIIHEAQYKFAKDAENSMGSEQYYNGLTDDSFIKIQRIQTADTGFAFTFRVPTEEQGYATGFKIGAKVKGVPGALRCYLLDLRDKDKFLNATQFETQYNKDVANENVDGIKFFAKSQPLQWDESEGKRYKYFTFQQDDGTYPLMSKDVVGEDPVRYLAIIECSTADTSNYYDFVFIQHKDTAGTLGDLELNNITYTYTKQSDDSSTSPFVTDEDINAYDMYHQIVTRAVIEDTPEAQRQGLYTAHYHADYLKYPATKARLMLRVKREGTYNAVTDEADLTNLMAVNITNTDSDSVINTINRLHLKSETIKRAETRTTATDTSEQTKTIVGNNICLTSGFSTDTISLDKYVTVRNGDKVYRMNYLVSMKARIVEYDPTTGTPNITDYDHYVLPLTAVYKDLNPSNSAFSDRMIFECDITKTDSDGYLIPYNDFEFQIFWENQDLPIPTDAERIDDDYMATIKDLVFSLDRGF